MKKKLNLFVYYYILILFLEVCYKLFVYKHLNIGFFFMMFFSSTIALIMYLITKLLKKRKQQHVITIILTIIVIFFFSFNFDYYQLLDVPFSVSTIGLADQAVDFYKIGLQTFIDNIIYTLIFSIPLILLILFHRNLDFSNYPRKKNKYILGLLGTYCLSILIIIPFKNSGYKYYFEQDNLLASIDTFGLVTSQRLNLKRYLFGFSNKIVIVTNDDKKDIVNSSEITYEPNKLDIDFNSLANQTNDEQEKSLYNYFANSIYTNKNEYTGIYKDKNLIFILAEGFNSIAVSEDLTPTLYKLTHTGFVFNNYYSPVFLSTTGGEFQATTGLIPTQEILALWRKNSPTFSYALGNSFGNLGYTTNAYHNWTYTYYKRDLTMPTLGFTNYIGCKNGMENLIDCKWLPSDIDMINTTSSLYMNEDRFITYYISVSGHAPYNFNGGNSIASKNENLVKDLPYSESVKAYLASQIEFDHAIEALINNLNNAGILDDTVIVITGDHYPYTLNENEINEISSYPRDELFEVNHSNLIIWNNNDKVIKEVNKIGSQIDILPTILNLFGVEYDSRMIIGHDILSNTEGVAIFSDHSWISDSGKYNANTKEFTFNGNVNITEDYVNNMNIRVDNSFIASKMILETDIYKKVLGDK